MVQWDNPTLEARLQVVGANIAFLVLGVYGWEYLSSLGVEYAVIRGRLGFRWALIPYLVGRMCSFIFILLLAIRMNPSSGTNDVACLPLTIFAAVAGDIGLGCASTNLMIRTWVIWRGSRVIHTLLLLVALGHWVVLALDIANFEPIQADGTCGVAIKHSSVTAAIFLYSLCYDFVVLVLCIVALSRRPSKSPLMKQLRAQGLVYFFVTFVTYISPTVFSFLGVATMVGITASIATTASTIASCRAVRSLLTPEASQSPETNESDVVLTTQIPVQTMPTSTC